MTIFEHWVHLVGAFTDIYLPQLLIRVVAYKYDTYAKPARHIRIV